jgi:hypothetical protein
VRWDEAAPRFPFEVILRTAGPLGTENTVMFGTCIFRGPFLVRLLEQGRGCIPREAGFPSVESGPKHLL